MSVPRLWAGSDYIVQVRLAQSKTLQLAVLLQPAIKEQTDCHHEYRRGRTLYADTAENLIKDGHAYAIDTDPHEGKGQFAFFVELFHGSASFEK